MDAYFNENKESLVDYFILPLVGLSYRAFGPYFKEAKLSRDLLSVRVKLSGGGCSEKFWDNPNYQTDWDQGSNTYAVFRIPEEFKDDVKVFATGKYSKMSDVVKKVIFKGSGLHYNKRIDNLIVTDMKLLALTKSPILKEWIEKQYRVKKGKNVEFLRLKNKDIIYYD